LEDAQLEGTIKSRGEAEELVLRKYHRSREGSPPGRLRQASPNKLRNRG
jgi:hypothetical protein